MTCSARIRWTRSTSRRRPMSCLPLTSCPRVRTDRRSHREVYGGDNDNQHRGQRLRARTLLMRWSGLAILDATSLERERLSKNENGDDQIFLYRAKTGVPVFVVIPNEVGDALRQLPNSNPRYFFWSGNGDARSAA